MKTNVEKIEQEAQSKTGLYACTWHPWVLDAHLHYLYHQRMGEKIAVHFCFAIVKLEMGCDYFFILSCWGALQRHLQASLNPQGSAASFCE